MTLADRTWVVFLALAVCYAPTALAGFPCGLVDGVVDGSTDADQDDDGIPDCLDDLPLVPGNPPDACVLVVDTFADGDDGECNADCTLREALEVAAGELCTIRLQPGTYTVDLGTLVGLNNTAIVGSGADVTIIDAEVAGPAMLLELEGVLGGKFLLSGLTLEFDGSGIRPETANTQLITTNCIIRGDPDDSPGDGLRFIGEQSNEGPHQASLRNTIIRDTGTAIDASGGSFVYATACRITGNGLGADLSWGFEYSSKLTLTDSELSDNGRGAYVRGSITGPSVGTGGILVLNRTLVSGNSGVADGGAIFLANGNFIVGGRATIIDSTFEGNHSDGSGGAIFAEGGDFPGRFAITGSTFHGNTATDGGAISLAETPTSGSNTVENSTFSGNTASGRGGAIFNDGARVILRSSTVTSNHATDGGGIFHTSGPGSADVTLHNTILGDNTSSVSGSDCVGPVFSWGYNLIGNVMDCSVDSEPTDLLSVPPELSPLADNGGHTPTHHPAPTSQAIDNGLDAESCPDDDQRDVPRPQGTGCDIGSVEVAPDADGDGVPDAIDGCPDDPGKSSPGQCGCHAQDTDTDGDGVADCVDLCSGDPDKFEPGICGCGTPDIDTDGDGLADCVDPCPSDTDLDGDGYGQTGDCPPGTPPDCNDADPDVHPGAPESNDAVDNQCPGDVGYGAIDETSGNSGFHTPGDKDSYSWPPQAGAVFYQAARATAVDFSTGCTLFPAASWTVVVDEAQPDSGTLFAYLNHAIAPNVGSWGLDSNGLERVVLCDWWDSLWQRRRRITFNNSAATEDLIDFPVLVLLDPSELPGQADGTDLRFVDPDDPETVLPYEIEFWQSLSAAVWVKIPRIDAGSTTDHVWLYYDNLGAGPNPHPASDVWDDGFVAVWHLGEETGPAVDSTSNQNDGFFGGELPSPIPGVAGDAQDLGGIADRVRLGESPSLSPTTALTIETWLRPTAATYPTWSTVFADWKDDPIDAGVSFHYSLKNGTVALQVSPFGLLGAENTERHEGTTILTPNEWNHTAATFDAGTFHVYVAGSPDASPLVSDFATVIFDSTNPKTIGVKNIPSWSFPYEGHIDEVRLSDVARSADWIRAQYLSQVGAFVNLGSEETQTAP